MSHSRRSLIRSSLEQFRRLWKRRDDARRQVRRMLGSSFELLEPRLAMTISAPLPSPTDHIHPNLQIYLDGQQVTIPSGVGIFGSSDANPHTHDLTGTLHVGEGGNAGTGSTIRNVTLQDFFDVWRSSTLTQASALNPNAIFDTDLTDGTPQPRILDKTVDGSHVLRMYVKEGNNVDSAPELEYDSSSATNDLTRPELYVPRDGDQIIISFDKAASVVDAPSFQPIGTQTVLGGAPSFLGIDGFDPTGGPLTYSVTSTNPLLTATLQSTSNKSLVLNVAGFGQMTFQLFDNLEPRTTQHIETLVNDGEFVAGAKFYRISRTDESQKITKNADGATTFSFGGVNASPITLSSSTTAAQLQATLSTIPALLGNISVTATANGGPFTVTFINKLAGTDVAQIAANNSNATMTTIANGNDFVIQGGPANPTSTLGQFDDEFNTDLQFTQPGLLAMAKSSDDTNDSQIFVTGGPARFLDMQHSIFGVLTEGDAVRQAIQHAARVPASSTESGERPVTDIVISSAQIITDTQNAALELKAAEGASGQADVTLTVHDAQGHTFAQTFHVNITPDTANSAPFLNPIAPVSGVQGQPITVQLSATDAENNPFFFDASKPAGETTNYTINVNNSTGLVTLTPPAGFIGTFHVTMGVRGTTTTTTADQFDTEDVLVTVAANAPTVDLVAGSDSGVSNSDNITNVSSLDFLVSNVTSGATVKLLKGTSVLAQGVASGTTITLTVANAGTALGQGQSAITATQTVGTQTSAASTALNVTFDTTAPTFTSTAPTTALVGFDLAYNAQTNDEGTTGLVYSLTSNSVGATINSSTGVVSWIPTSTQTGPQTFNVVATDAAGNAATQALSLAVATAQVDLTIKLTKTDGTALTSLSTGQDFILHVFAKDLRTGQSSAGVFAAYADVTWDSTKAAVTGPIQYSTTFGSGHSGDTSAPGLINEGGAFAGTSPTGTGNNEIFSVPMRASGTGALTFTLDPPDDSPTHDILVYGGTGSVPLGQVHFGTASADVGSTFNAVNDAFNVNEDTSNDTINPLANDTNIGSNTSTLTISAVGTPNSGGAVTIASDSKSLKYTPAANFHGSETFTYTARNQNGETHTATVTMTVADVNDLPVAINDTFDESRNSTANVLNVLANDTTGPDSGETLRVSAVGTGNHGGAITIGANGANILYAPAANFTGAETFTYTISDRATGGLTAQATVTVNVSGLTANADTFTVAEDSAATTLDVLANDALDSQFGGTLTITGVGTPDHGATVSVTQTGTRISYTPAANFQGTEKFTYTISDGQGHSATGTVTMTVTNVNDAPVATNDTLTGFKNTTASFDVLANDTSGPDPTENLLIDSIGTQPTHGTATITDGGKKISYVPTSGYTGPDSFTYTIKDPGGLTSTATANLTVQDFAPSVLSGFAYFDVNNNGTLDANERPIVGVTITLTGTATAGSNTNVNQSVRTGEDGSYKFENLAPGNYTLKETQPLFTIDGKDTAGSQAATVTNNQMVINLAQGTTGTGNNFGELGRELTTITLRDFFSSTSRNYAHAAFDSSGNELWHSTTGSVWQGTSKNDFSLISSQTQIKLDSTTAQSQIVTRTLATDLPVYKSGTSGSNLLYYVPGGPAGTSSNPTPTNQSPTANADAYSTPVSTALNVTAANGVLKNDTDPEGNSLTAAIVTQPAHGTITLNADGSFAFTPTTGFTGTDTFTYKTSDGNSQSAAATVTLNIGINTAPTGLADAYTATEDQALTVTAANGVLKNDTDLEGNSLTAAVNSQPAHGTVTMTSNGAFTYTPATDFNGSDTFTYKASDASLQSAVTTVTITVTAVNDAPHAVNDSFFATKDTTLTTAAPGVLTNDTDVDSAALSVQTTPIAAPTHGALTLNANGSFSYAPTTGFTGTDTFTYRVTDGALTADAVATIVVNPPANVAPVANADSFSTPEDTALVVTTANGLLLNDTDANSNPLTAINATTPANGTLSFNSNGTFTYTPNANFHGTDTFTYQANDGTSSSTPATVTITVSPLNDAPTAAPDSYRIDQDTTLTVNANTGVLANDNDVDGDTLTAAIVDQPAHGSVTLNSNGSFNYTPIAGFTGNDSFTYKASDGSLQSTTTTVAIAVNTAPVALNDSYTTNEDTALTINAAQGVLNNDTDSNGDTLTAVIVAQPQHGTLTLNTNGSFTYTPNGNFNGSDTFRYQANDGLASSAAATVTISITAVNDAPTTAPDSYLANAGTQLSVSAGQGVLSNDDDAENDPLTVSLVGNVAHGTLTLNPDGSFTYTANANFHGDDTFTYTVNDTQENSVETTVTIHVNAPPVAVNDAYTTDEDTQLVVDAASGVLSNDTDADNNTPSATITTQPQHGTVTLQANGSFIYTPNPNFHGTDGFSYVASDGLATSNAAAVTITINSVNDIPQGNFDSYDVAENGTLNVPLLTNVLKNDTDADNDPLTAQMASLPANGVLSLNPNGTFTYIPEPGFHGTDTFTYRADDGTAQSNVTTVSITVHEPPTVANDNYTTPEDTALVTDLQNGVLFNDTTVNSQPISADVVDQPANGTLTFSADGTFTYHPNLNFHGTDTFTYTASDGVATSALATVTITITSVNDAPVAVPDSYDTTPGNTLVVAQADGVLKNDSDADNDSLTAILVTNPTNGNLVFDPNGSFSYTPTSGFSGTDSFTYKANDGTVGGNTVTVTLNVILPGGEGEGLSVQDAALLDYLGGLNNSSHVDSASWIAAVDQAMAQLS